MILELTDKTDDCSSLPVFVLCNRCYWCATYLDKTGRPKDYNCPKCNADNIQSSNFPIGLVNQHLEFNSR